MQAYFTLAVFRRQDEEEVTPSFSIVLNRSPDLKKHNSSFTRTECTKCRTFGTLWKR
eukprot:IDg823t1